MLKYTCNDPECAYCQWRRDICFPGPAILPESIQYEIRRSGGFQDWRDKVLLENSKNTGESRIISQRINTRALTNKRKRVLV